MPPEILVNDLCLYTSGTGVTIYLRNLLAHWPAEPSPLLVGMISHRLRRGNAWPAGRAMRPSPDHRRLHELGNPGVRRAIKRPALELAYRVYRAAFAIERRRGGYAAAWEPNHVALTDHGVVVTTVHDLSLLENPQWHPADRVRRWERGFERTCAATTQWITVSEFTRRRMTAMLGVDERAVTVAPLAARPLRYPESRELDDRRAALRLPARYLLHVGTIEPRKNLATLLDAYGQLDPALRRDCVLVLVGEPGWGAEAFWRGLVDHPMAESTVVTGYVSDDDLGVLIAGAEALLQPSHYEGFGLPVIEAMAGGLPVACSDIDVFREVGGEAVRYLDPGDAESWAAFMRCVIDEPDALGVLREGGRRRAAAFSWDRAARTHRDALTCATSSR